MAAPSPEPGPHLTVVTALVKLEVRQGDGVWGGTQRPLRASEAAGLGWGTAVPIFKPFVTFKNGCKWRVVWAKRGFLLRFTLPCQVSISQQR